MNWPAAVWWWLGTAFCGLALIFLMTDCARAQSDCSQSVGTTPATAVAFPATNTQGNPKPTSYLEICNSHASQTLGVNWLPGGAAVIGSAGTQTLAAGACKKWTTLVDGFVPGQLSLIGSASSTTTTCAYK